MPCIFRGFAACLASVLLCAGVPASAQSPTAPKQAVAADQPSPKSLADYTGSVRYGDTRKPAAGVRVYFEMLHNGICPITVATTDANGIFHLPRAVFRPTSPWEAAYFQVDDPRGRYTAEGIYGESLPDGTLNFPKDIGGWIRGSAFISLQTGTFVSGTVTNAATGLPLSGIRVYAMGPHNRHTFREHDDGLPADAYVAVTDAAGHYRLPVAPGACDIAVDHPEWNDDDNAYGLVINHDLLNEGDDNYQVAVTAVQGKTSMANLALPSDELARLQRERVATQELAIKAATGVTGRIILSGTGASAANWTIHIDDHWGWFHYDQQTDNEGHYFFRNLKPNTSFTLSLISPENHASLSLSEGKTLSGKTLTVPDIQIAPETIVQGTITDSTSGKSIADAYVGCSRAGVRTGPDGRYRMIVASGTNCYVAASAEQNRKVRSDAFTIAPNETRTVNLVMPPALSIEGTIVDETGKPIASVPIGIGRFDDTAAQIMFDATNHRVSDATGHWSIPDLAHDAAGYRVLVGTGWQIVRPTPEQPLMLSAGAKVEVVLRHLSTISIPASHTP